MNATNSSSSGAGPLILILLVTLVAAALLAIWLIGAEILRTIGLILAIAVALALVIGASALPIRARHRTDNLVEHHYHDGTKTIVKEIKVLDGRAPAQNDIKLLQLPAAPQAGAFPELLRAAYQSGATALPGRTAPAPALSWNESEPEDADLTGYDGWTGDITG